MTSAGAASIVMLELVCSAIAVAPPVRGTGRSAEACRQKAIACAGRIVPGSGRHGPPVPVAGPGHHSRAHGRPVDAKCPTFTHSVAPIRIRRASGWWTWPKSAYRGRVRRIGVEQRPAAALEAARDGVVRQLRDVGRDVRAQHVDLAERLDLGGVLLVADLVRGAHRGVQSAADEAEDPAADLDALAVEDGGAGARRTPARDRGCRHCRRWRTWGWGSAANISAYCVRTAPIDGGVRGPGPPRDRGRSPGPPRSGGRCAVRRSGRRSRRRRDRGRCRASGRRSRGRARGHRDRSSASAPSPARASASVFPCTSLTTWTRVRRAVAASRLFGPARMTITLGRRAAASGRARRTCGYFQVVTRVDYCARKDRQYRVTQETSGRNPLSGTEY